MKFTEEVKDALHKQPVDYETHELDEWIFFIVESSLSYMHDVTFPEMTVRHLEDFTRGEHFFLCTQLLFKGETVAEKFSYGNWDDIFDEEDDWVNQTHQKEMMQLIFDKYIELKCSSYTD